MCFCCSLFKVILKAYQQLNSAALIRAACMRSSSFRQHEMNRFVFQRNAENLCSALCKLFLVFQKRMIDLKTEHILDFIECKAELPLFMLHNVIPQRFVFTHYRTSLCIYQIGFESPEVCRALLNYTTKQAFFTGFDRCCISCFFDMILIVFSNILSQIIDIHRQKCYLIQDGSLRAVRRCRQDLRTYE